MQAIATPLPRRTSLLIDLLLYRNDPLIISGSMAFPMFYRFRQLEHPL